MSAQEKIRQWIGEKSEILLQVAEGNGISPTIYTVSKWPGESTQDGDEIFYLTRCFQVGGKWVVSKDIGGTKNVQECYNYITNVFKESYRALNNGKTI